MRLSNNKNWQGCSLVGVHDVIIQSNFGFNIFRGFTSTGDQNFRFPFDFAGHRYPVSEILQIFIIFCWNSHSTPYSTRNFGVFLLHWTADAGAPNCEGSRLITVRLLSTGELWVWSTPTENLLIAITQHSLLDCCNKYRRHRCKQPHQLSVKQFNTLTIHAVHVSQRWHQGIDTAIVRVRLVYLMNVNIANFCRKSAHRLLSFTPVITIEDYAYHSVRK